ncbi:MAG: hypothetical protein CM15mP59_3110 [Flavobacteriaceae bacterium]|nr:MAG: hypothetical protein CM15mP59_3110 [Flavobacteriaceae bacterium]
MASVLVMLVMPYKKHVESYGYGVVRELVGHGLGKRCTKNQRCQTMADEEAEKLLQRHGRGTGTHD